MAEESSEEPGGEPTNLSSDRLAEAAMSAYFTGSTQGAVSHGPEPPCFPEVRSKPVAELQPLRSQLRPRYLCSPGSLPSAARLCWVPALTPKCHRAACVLALPHPPASPLPSHPAGNFGPRDPLSSYLSPTGQSATG